ncbi:diguanylate cyclase (GGDEF)-like protein [Salsuginibacillus halophilus]|uniref:Diguanylate cyclase (GGDEF)-like protein n=1 Tax=Salsuginibacillus halophilus TaxID=517424 RepID=A0A2P8HXD8_9BACI|nr:EAL domain-containing protein [Salsuginibacillus halophilus]PSL50868.1 diguanylate cyclase (GGDEF)-like protein [Salsuginibacillus halophilus]
MNSRKAAMRLYYQITAVCWGTAVMTAIAAVVFLPADIPYVFVVTTLGFVSIVMQFLIKKVLFTYFRPLFEVEQFLRKVSLGDEYGRLLLKTRQFHWLGQHINRLLDRLETHIQRYTKETDEVMAQLAYKDELTGLANRRKFRDLVDEAINASVTGLERNFAVVYLDLDGFKSVNDTLGHQAGDDLLVAVTERLQASLSKGAMLARGEGDVFTLLLTEAYSAEKTKQNVEQLLSVFSKPFQIGDDAILLAGTAGIAFYPKDGTTYESLIRNADAAMYAGRKSEIQASLYEPEMNERYLAQAEIDKELRLALDRDEFSIHFQPQVDYSTSEVVGVEALLRWDSYKLGRISPAQFIPVLERSPLMNKVGAWVLEEACRTNRQWQDEGHPAISMSVNMSARQFQQADLIENVKGALERTGLDASCLTVEVTESVAMENIEKTEEKMKALKALGVNIAIDDFGTGYSSLKYLKVFPIDILKIDREFIKDVAASSNDGEIVTAIIALARSLKIRVVAEGVEDIEQLYFLNQQQCAVVQGYLYAKPMLSSELKQWLGRRKDVIQAVASRGA